jgi:hypothetical protein
MKNIFKIYSIKTAQAAPPALPPMAPPPMAPPAAPGVPGASKAGDVTGVDASKLDKDPSDTHVERLNSFLKPLLRNHDLDIALSLACAADGSRVSPGMLDVQMTGDGAPRIRQIIGIDRGPSSPSAPPPMG